MIDYDIEQLLENVCISGAKLRKVNFPVGPNRCPLPRPHGLRNVVDRSPSQYPYCGHSDEALRFPCFVSEDLDNTSGCCVGDDVRFHRFFVASPVSPDGIISKVQTVLVLNLRAGPNNEMKSF